MLDQRRGRLAHVVQMLYKGFLCAGSATSRTSWPPFESPFGIQKFYLLSTATIEHILIIMMIY